MNLDKISLRALEPSDIEVLLKIENDDRYWKYANRTEPYSRNLLQKYIEQQKQDIFEVRQKRFAISLETIDILGFIDIFDFEPIHRRAGIGIFILEKYRGNGIGKKSVTLIGEYAKKNLNLNCIYANIAKENISSINLFESCGFKKIGLKREWNFYENSFHGEYLYQRIFNV